MSIHTLPDLGKPPGTAPGASPATAAVSLPRLRDMAGRGEKITVLTAYDATFARVLDNAGVDVLQVGDFLGNVVQGQTSTLPVTLEHMTYHTACVARGRQRAWLVADMPFGSYEAGPAGLRIRR